MIIHFSASAQRSQDDKDVYSRIRGKMSSLGHSIANDRADAGRQAQESPVGSAMHSIENAELLIAVISSDTTVGVGYEIAYALQQKKPVLALMRDGEAESYLLGVDNELLACKAYKPETVERLVEEFIMDNTVSTKDLRFNFVIDRRIHNHLRWKAYKTGRTKAEVVRDLLAEDMKSSGR